MPTVFFDFDSTLVSCESLEEILKSSRGHQPEVIDQIANITQLGMDGKISFAESLQRRLKITQPTLSDIIEFANNAEHYLTSGMESLIPDLQCQGVKVFIISGGLKEAIIPVAIKLHIPLNHIHAVQLIWDSKGNFIKIDPENKFSQSKVEGFKSLSINWSKPIIAIGDGMTDLALYEHGLVDHFILFTQHVLRSQLISRTPNVASNVVELKKLLEQWL